MRNLLIGLLLLIPLSVQALPVTWNGVNYECTLSGTPPPPPPPSPVTCTSFTYSDWGICQNGTQTRTVIASFPSGCTGGNPVLTQTCTSPPPPSGIPLPWSGYQNVHLYPGEEQIYNLTVDRQLKGIGFAIVGVTYTSDFQFWWILPSGKVLPREAGARFIGMDSGGIFRIEALTPAIPVEFIPQGVHTIRLKGNLDSYIKMGISEVY